MTAGSPTSRILIINDSGKDIPSRSIVVVTSVTIDSTGPGQESLATHHVKQYGCGMVGNVYVTGLGVIANGKKGSAYSDTLIYVSIDTSVSS